MALALTYKTNEKLITKCAKGFKQLIGELTLTGTYTAGGEAMDISAYFPTELQLVLIETKAGFAFEYDYTAKKVKAYCSGELAHTTTDLPALTDHDDNPTYHAVHSAVALTEVATGVAITAASGVKFIAIGI